MTVYLSNDIIQLCRFLERGRGNVFYDIQYIEFSAFGHCLRNLLHFLGTLHSRQEDKGSCSGYVHPKEGKNCDLVWCYRLMYREQKAGKRLYCYTRKTYDTREEMRAKYPKGTEVNIKHYVQDKDSDEMGIILDDNDDRKVQWMYTLTAVLGCIGLGVGYQLLLLQMGR